MSGGAWGLVAVGVLVLAAAFLSTVETVLARLDLIRALRMDEEDAPGAERLVWLLERRAQALNVVLVLTVTVRIAAAVLIVLVADALSVQALGVVGAAVLLVAVSLVLAEVAPRTLTLRHLEATGLRIAPVATALTRTLGPLARLFVGAGRALVRERGAVSGPYAPDDEVEEHLADEEGDELEEDELAMIHSIFELGDTAAREIMVPRPDMVTVDEHASLDEVVAVIIERGYSRIPVHRGRADQIAGVIYAKDVLKRIALHPEQTSWRDLIRTATFVPETVRLDDLLRNLQEQTVHQAIVVDEYGAVVGLVTIEDILEEIVGEIVDEHDSEDPLVEVLDDASFRVDARLPVAELNELFETELPSEGWDTVGGLVFGMLGHVPSPGEAVDIDGLHMIAERVQGRRVSKVLVSRRDDGRVEPPEDEIGAGEPDGDTAQAPEQLGGRT